MAKHSKTLINHTQLSLTIERLCHQLIENHDNFAQTVLIGIQPRGVYFSDSILNKLKQLLPKTQFDYGWLDITFYRDDFRRREELLSPSSTNINFIIENKKVVLIDDVLYTGRTIRAAMDALQALGRPSLIELMVLIDRKFSRQIPVQADYVGAAVDSITSQKVKVNWKEKEGENNVVLLSNKNNQHNIT